MKIGYSNILGDHVAAELLDYKDCELFQIVCPCCREPLFKAVRNNGSSETHFLSHYEASKAYAAECELRAKDYDAGALQAANAFSREQRLTYFIERFTQMLDRLPLWEKPGARARWNDLIRKNDVSRRVRETLYQAGATVDLPAMIEGRAAETYELWDAEGFAPKTGFGREQQTRAAVDMARTMWTPHGRQAFNQCFTVAWASLASQVAGLERARENADYVRVVGAFIVTMPMRMTATESRRLEGMVTSTPVPPPYGDTPGATWFDRICWSLWEQFVDVLLLTDFLGALKERQSATH